MTSAIPSTITALHTLWSAALPRVDVRKLLTLSGDAGTPLDNIWRRVNVGWIPETDGRITADREWASIGNRWLSEDFDVPCSLECVSGDEDVMVLLEAGYTLLDELSAALATDNTLGGLVQQGAAILGRSEAIPKESESGGGIEIQFVVHCETRIEQ